ncbi:MAG: two pore domain potassium channel family protein [Planctomycetes bacterium]|nr:two pore domain potassium channel family protein [Planctomycetota bacterium]
MRTALLSRLTHRALVVRPGVLLGVLLASYSAIAFTFALVYTYLPSGLIESDSDSAIQFDDCLHFSLTTQSTLGYGDYRPTGLKRYVAAGQTLVGLLLDSVIIGIVVFRLTTRRARIAFPDACGYDPQRNDFLFCFRNDDADDLVQVNVNVSLGRVQQVEEDPVILRRGFGLKLDLFRDTYTPAGLLTSLRTVSDDGHAEQMATLKAVDNIIGPIQLREKDALILSVSGLSLNGGNPVYARKQYWLDQQEIKCGVYSFSKMQPTEEEECRACRYHADCPLDVAKRMRGLASNKAMQTDAALRRR